MLPITSIRLERDSDVSHARRTARTAVDALGHDLHDQTRFATAVSEIARNALQYGREGQLDFKLDREGRQTLFLAVVNDSGPGIAVLDRVMRGYSPNSQGLGLGLRGAKRISDRFDIQTGQGGTIVTLGLRIQSHENLPALANRIAKALTEAARRNPIDELTEQNRALRDALARQAFLQRELHHRTKNNLAIIRSLASMQARQVETEEAKEALLSLAGRVHALGLVHSFLHHADASGQIDLRDYLEELVGTLQQAMGREGVEMACEVEPLSLEPDRAVEIGIVVNELVTNALKHARPNGSDRLAVRIHARAVQDQLRVTVGDNGRPAENAECKLRSSGSMGMRVVEASARKLRASIEFNAGRGLSATLTCPLI